MSVRVETDFMKRYFEKNLQYLAFADADLARRMAATQLNGHVNVQPAKNGQPTATAVAADGQRILIHSQHDPVADAAAFVASRPLAEHDAYVVGGFGLGYHLLELINRVPRDKWIAVVEPNVWMMRAAMEFVDLEPLLRRPRVLYCVGADQQRFLAWARELLNVTEAQSMLIMTYPPAARLVPGFHALVEQELQVAINKRIVELTTLSRYCQDLDLNCLRNLPEMARAAGVQDFANKFRGIPAFVVAAGPSLDQTVDALAAVKGRAVIISVGKSLRLLAAKGIVPEFTVSLDLSPLSQSCFEGFSIPAGVNLVFDPDCYYGIPATYPHDKITFDTAAWMVQWSKKFIGAKGTLQKGLSVAHSAWYFAIALGCDPIVFVGVDLALPTDHTHASGVTMTWGGKVEPKEGDPNVVMVPSVTGGKVRTIRSMLSFITTFEQDIALMDRTVINTSRIGALIRGCKNLTIEETIQQYCQEARPIDSLVKAGLEAPRPYDRTAAERAIRELIESAQEVRALCRDGMRHMKRASKLDPGNRYDAEALQRLAHKVNKIKDLANREQELIQCLQRFLSRDILELRSIEKKLAGARDAKERMKLDIERMTKTFEAYERGCAFLMEHLPRIREQFPQ